MLRRLFVLLSLFALTLLIVYVPRQNISHAASPFVQTRITRTPTPAPPPPTDVPPDNPPPTAQATEAPTLPPTNTPIPVTLVATPAGGFLPTASACGAPPTVQTRGNTLVRSGPGTTYPSVGQLVYLEVRPIAGRAGDAPWWLIVLANGQTGWIANEVVVVHGYTGDVPIVAAPAINGQTPTAGAPWQPTAVPGCPTSTPTTMPPTQTATPRPTNTQTAVPQTTATASPTTESAPPTATATSVVPTADAQAELVDATGEATPEATAVPLDDNAGNGVAALPCASAAMGLAVAAFFISRRFW